MDTDDRCDKDREDHAEILIGQEDIFTFLQDQPSVEQNLPENTVQLVEECSEQNGDESGFLFSKDGQMSFVDSDEWWKEHWVGMPEFVQDDATPWKSIYVHFRCYEDLQEFAELINQRITSDTPSIWHPLMPREKRMHMGYIYES